MLTPAEADLVRRDPTLPGLATVLDAGAFLAALNRVALGRDVRRAEIRYVKYKPRTYCRVTYGVEVAGAQFDLEARACLRQDFCSRLEEDGATVPGPLGPGRLVFRDSAVIATVFPNDSSLPQVPGLTDPARRARLLRELLPDWPELWEGGMRCLRYWPGRRYSAELMGRGGSRALVKAYTRKGYRRARRNAELFRSSGPLRVARLLGSSDRHRLLAFEWLPGHMLSQLWLSPEVDREVVTATGEALAALHAQPANGLECWPREDEGAYLRSLAGEIGFLSPPLAAHAERLAGRLAERLEGAPPLHFPVHCDFSDSQVLADGKDVAIVDLDSACCGDPADDLGGILSQTESYSLGGRLSRARAETMREALLEGYRRSPNGLPSERIATYTAAGLLRRARFAFRARSRDWWQNVEASLERAEAIVGPG